MKSFVAATARAAGRQAHVISQMIVHLPREIAGAYGARDPSQGAQDYPAAGRRRTA